jgi:hypothetical protein
MITISRLAVVYVALVTLVGCKPHPPIGGPIPIGVDDPILSSRRRMAVILRLVDSAGRDAGRLPGHLQQLQAVDSSRRKDAWGELITYAAHDDRFELGSNGPDRIRGTQDDILMMGRLGRNLPCEIRVGARVLYLDEQAPRCQASGGWILPLCPRLNRRPANDPVAISVADSIALTGTRLVRYAWSVDERAREIGALPASLGTVLGYPRVANGRDLADAWGRAVRFTARDSSFELRSSGADATFNTPDDIFLNAIVGTDIHCRYRSGAGEETCRSQPPNCPVKGDSSETVVDRYSGRMVHA